MKQTGSTRLSGVVKASCVAVAFAASLLSGTAFADKFVFSTSALQDTPRERPPYTWRKRWRKSPAAISRWISTSAAPCIPKARRWVPCKGGSSM